MIEAFSQFSLFFFLFKENSVPFSHSPLKQLQLLYFHFCTETAGLDKGVILGCLLTGLAIITNILTKKIKKDNVQP